MLLKSVEHSKKMITPMRELITLLESHNRERFAIEATDLCDELSTLQYKITVFLEEAYKRVYS